MQALIRSCHRSDAPWQALRGRSLNALYRLECLYPGAAIQEAQSGLETVDGGSACSSTLNAFRAY